MTNSLNSQRETKKRMSRSSTRERLSKMNNPEYFARTFLIAGLVLIIGSSSFLNREEIPKVLTTIGLVLGVVMNILAGLIYYSLSKSKE
ncbi:MAG: hypothetical protein RBS51_01570 [Anaerovoracaceae bacterium]|nr:hypothetical protein [Anaerovoracaceae bacterium]